MSRKELTMEKRNKQLATAAAVIAGLYFFPTIMNTARHAMITGNPATIEKPSPAKPIPLANVPNALDLPNPVTNTGTPADPKYSALLGKYMGGAILKTRECKGNLELGANPTKPDEFTGYITLVCYAPFSHKEVSPLTNPVLAIGTESTPASAILSGKAVNGVIQLHADKTVETLADGCPITGISISPFGDKQIAVDWQEGKCEGGQLIFQRTT
jgi:hypothetical protein